MRTFGLGLLSIGLLVACATSPAPKAAAAKASTAAPVAVASNGEQKTCHVEQKTGSNMSKRVCLTQAEAAERAKKDQQGTSRFLEDRSTHADQPGG